MYKIDQPESVKEVMLRMINVEAKMSGKYKIEKIRKLGEQILELREVCERYESECMIDEE